MRDLFDGEHHRKAITSRPARLGGVARMTRHSGQGTVKVSLQHQKGEELQKVIVQVSRQLHRFNSITERWSEIEPWTCLLTYIFRRWLGGKWVGERPAESRVWSNGNRPPASLTPRVLRGRHRSEAQGAAPFLRPNSPLCCPDARAV
jgi:hypothetical protein